MVRAPWNESEQADVFVLHTLHHKYFTHLLCENVHYQCVGKFKLTILSCGQWWEPMILVKVQIFKMIVFILYRKSIELYSKLLSISVINVPIRQTSIKCLLYSWNRAQCKSFRKQRTMIRESICSNSVSRLKIDSSFIYKKI